VDTPAADAGPQRGREASGERGARSRRWSAARHRESGAQHTCTSRSPARWPPASTPVRLSRLRSTRASHHHPHHAFPRTWTAATSFNYLTCEIRFGSSLFLALWFSVLGISFCSVLCCGWMVFFDGTNTYLWLHVSLDIHILQTVLHMTRDWKIEVRSEFLSLLFYPLAAHDY
jgi:hypothetical protein